MVVGLAYKRPDQNRDRSKTAARTAGAAIRAEVLIRIGPGANSNGYKLLCDNETEVGTCDCDGFATSGPFGMRAADWNKVSAPVSDVNCFGKLLRDRGQRRVPAPPQRRTG